jgi:flagellar assembly protein FliH
VVKSRAAESYRSAIAFDLADVEAQAAGIIAKARSEAAGIIEGAKKSGETIRREAGEKGHTEGFNAGRTEGLTQGRSEAREEAFAQARDEIAAISSALAGACSEFSSHKDALFTQAQMDLLKLTILIARKIVAREIAADAHVTFENVKRCLDLLSQRKNLIVRVAPSAETLVKERLPELSKTLGELSSVKLVADESVRPGGCLVTAESGVLDATIESQFAEVERILFGDTNA